MTALPGAAGRDLRIDLFRGIAMIIILIAHIPNDTWALFIPGRYGFSDSTEIFVFCSGYASARAFGRVFREAGFGMGVVRVLFRCWQIYWAHIALFAAVAAICVLANTLPDAPKDYVGALNLTPFFRDTETNLVGLLTLSYVPNFFDILPMYITILAMVPVVMLLHRLHPMLPFLGCAALYAFVQVTSVNFGAEPWSDRPWFFNPMGWQLVFFSGFAIGMRWFTPPATSRRGIALAAGLLVLAVPLSWWPLLRTFPTLAETREAIGVLVAKTDFGLLRWLHFLAIAYLGRALMERLPNLATASLLRPVVKIGQQSLAVFLASMALAWVLGVVLDYTGREAVPMMLVNVFGIGVLILVAYVSGFVRSTPWKVVRASGAGSAAGRPQT
jgi:hypothetical protein